MISRKFDEILDWLTRISFSFWSPILVSFCAICILFIFIIPYNLASGWEDSLSLVTTLGFGAVSIVGTLTSIAVFHHVRGVLTHWTTVSQNFFTLVERANSTLYIVSENPAFLQAFSEREFKRWVRALQEKIGLHNGIPNLRRVVFLYPRREILEGKINDWSAGDMSTKQRMVTQLTHDHIFGWFFSSRKSEIAQIVRFVPLDVRSLDYFIFVSDENRSSIFCRSYLKGNISQSNLQGFRTVDRPLVEAFRHMVGEIVSHSGCVYHYKCRECNNDDNGLFFTDDQILINFNSNSFDDFGDEKLSVKCPTCSEVIALQARVAISSLTEEQRKTVYDHIFLG